MNTSITGADPEEFLMFLETFQAYSGKSILCQFADNYPNRTVVF